MIVAINISTGEEFILYPPLYRVKPVGYPGIRYPLPSLGEGDAVRGAAPTRFDVQNMSGAADQLLQLSVLLNLDL